MSHKYLFLIAFTLFIAACSSPKNADDNTAEKYFQKGEEAYESGLYEDAIGHWEKVRDTYYSPALNMLAELKIAESYYQAERYEEAATAYEDFLKQHPNDNRLDDVLYRLGLSHYQQILSADRDQTSTRNAMRSFEELLRRYPEYPQAEEAEMLIQRCRNRLAEHEVYVGNFYLKRKSYQAAIKRFESTLQEYPNYYYQDEILFYLGKAYLKANQKEKSEQIFNQLAEQFPGSEYQLKAMELLAEENQDS
ncbi:Beta-barrel assembly machine subunit BamD [Malonomonas rubra DSM 5091]|uniref:Beta-barrel assembly machine subunit BamD n=1 Tax=Malonomonas rubra DSM 5091 TaxID=1122189 RepID=A0A1M6M6T8_MALRU|nr:outer membrane protein assembly factor BamD [Malonomonas rubra]SHJ79134.1 Beta-barrel assembly machine subunit BamD [Malonomonas rubra DSM 5091]